MAIAVLGSSSQIGMDLFEEVGESHAYNFYTREQCNLYSKSDLKKTIPGHDLVINLAAYTNVELSEKNKISCLRANFIGPKNLALLCSELKIPLIHISTDYVFDGNKLGRYNENDKTNPINFYGASKLLSEEVINKYLDEYLIIRTSWVFGKQKNNFFKTMLRMFLEGKDVSVIDDQLGAPTSSLYLAKTIVQIAKRSIETNFSQWGIYNITGFPYCSWYQFSEEIKEICIGHGLNINSTIEATSSKNTSYMAKRPENSRLNTEKAQKVFDITPDDWKSSLISDFNSKKIQNIINEYDR